MDLISEIDTSLVPKHVAIIMDGNGRWAEKQGELRIFGHTSGVRSVREALTAAGKVGVEYLTLYAFSTENWNRPKEEVNALMDLLVNTIANEIDELNQKNVRLRAIGDLENLPPKCFKELQDAIAKTESNTGVTLVLALSYSARWEITRAIQRISVDIAAKKVEPEEINDSLISSYLATAEFPDPELLIRTSGECRISNFLLWQIAYSELHFTETLWPDFTREHFYKAILDYTRRERRFGLTSEQLNESENA